MSAEHGGTSEYILHHLTNLKLDLHTMQINNEATGFWVLHLDSMVFSVFLAIVFLLMFMTASRKATSGVPGKWQAFIELCVTTVDLQVKDAYHHGARFVAPMALTVGFWIFFMNFMDMLPVDLLPHVAGMAGVGHLRTVPSTDPNVAIGMSLTVFLIAFGYSFVAKGFGGVAGEFLFHPFGKWMMPVNFLLKCVEELAKPISLGLRLFGNMYAGEMIFILLATFTLSATLGAGGKPVDMATLVVFALLGGACWMAFFKGWAKTGLALMVGVPVAGLAGLIPGVGAFAFAEVLLATGWTLFHILIISLQAYIFMTLTVVYMAMAADHH